MRLGKKVALITGGYGGMGRASARLIAKEGATVFIAGRNKERGDALAAEINDGGRVGLSLLQTMFIRTCSAPAWSLMRATAAVVGPISWN
jgi:NAD(P)-dependent dehydrogenase (short-subunit alcohol dehydrogenase family)